MLSGGKFDSAVDTRPRALPSRYTPLTKFLVLAGRIGNLVYDVTSEFIGEA